MKYRKKPIEAIQLGDSPERLDEALTFCGRPGNGVNIVYDGGTLSHALAIDTPEGRMLVRLGDWIIRDANGDLSSCRDDIFRATYELVEEVAEGAMRRQCISFLMSQGRSA